MKLLLASPRGFCAGVDRAIAIVDQMLAASGERVFVHHEIVHNRAVVEALRARGAIFVENAAEIPIGALAVVSAHGAPPAVFAQAEARKLRLMDATCPLVSKVHLEVERHARQGRSVIVIGHRDHIEVKGIVAHHPASTDTGIVVVEDEEEARAAIVPTPERVGYVTQTTLAVDQTRRIVDVLRERFPELVSPHASDICYATQNRQAALRRLAPECDLILILGAPHSSNSVRLLEVARAEGADARLIEDPKAIEAAWLDGARVIGLTSSASAPEYLVQEAITRLRSMVRELRIETIGGSEDVRFRLPASFPEFVKRQTRADTQSVRINPLKPSYKGSTMAETLKDAAGLEDVIRSVRVLARNARELVEQAGGVAERELAMIMTVAEDARDRVISKEGLEKGRSHPLFGAVRGDAHRAVDLGFDAVSTAYVTAVDVVEGFLDRPRDSRPQLSTGSTAV